jgi:aminoglycoside phosphotransferase (APT) family kinase protein
VGHDPHPDARGQHGHGQRALGGAEEGDEDRDRRHAAPSRVRELPIATAVDRQRRGVFLEKADLALPDERLAALRSAPDESLGIDAAFLRDAMDAFGISPSVRCTRAAAQGTFHRLYDIDAADGEAKLLRVAVLPGDAAAQVMALEARLAESLRGQGFAVPACEYRGIARAGQVRGTHLMERAAGQALTTLDDDEPRMQAGLAQVARFLARLHAVRGTGFGPLSVDPGAMLRGVHERWEDYVLLRLDEHLRACEATGAMTSSEARAAMQCFDKGRALLREQPAVLLHGDPGSHNFMVDASGEIRAVLDWEDALLGDPLFDLASLCTFHPERRHAGIASAYGETLTPGSDAWRRFWLYFLRIALAKTVHRQRFGYADAPGRAPASRRIQLALQRLGEA